MSFPALLHLLTFTYGDIPFECCDCAFGTPSCQRNPSLDPPNWADPGEGDYDCALLKQQEIWGENPQCTRADWQKKAIQELATQGIQIPAKET